MLTRRGFVLTAIFLSCLVFAILIQSRAETELGPLPALTHQSEISGSSLEEFAEPTLELPLVH